MSAAIPPFERQAKLWLVSFVVSVGLNALVVAVLAFTVLDDILVRSADRKTGAKETWETIATLQPVVAGEATIQPAALPQVEPAAEPQPAPEPEVKAPEPEPEKDLSFARTSPDQMSEEAPENPKFRGENNSLAASDAPPVASAPDQPSQKGEEPDYDDQIETTESIYQDGLLAPLRGRAGPLDPGMPGTPSILRGQPEEPSPPAPPARAESESPPDPPAEVPEPKKADVKADTEPQKPEEAGPEPAGKSRLAEGSLPVERRVPQAPDAEEEKAPPPQELPWEVSPMPETSPAPPAQPKQASRPDLPEFRGNQTKTRLTGSIGRTGRSALDVEQTLIGRYQAAINRAVEKEWQLNCIRNRDYVSEGLLMMSFIVDQNGKVLEIRVVDELRVGAIPKAFTLRSINDAEIPPMPPALRKELDGEPVEILIRFSF